MLLDSTGLDWTGSLNGLTIRAPNGANKDTFKYLNILKHSKYTKELKYKVVRAGCQPKLKVLSRAVPSKTCPCSAPPEKY